MWPFQRMYSFRAVKRIHGATLALQSSGGRSPPHTKTYARFAPLAIDVVGAEVSVDQACLIESDSGQGRVSLYSFACGRLKHLVGEGGSHVKQLRSPGTIRHPGLGSPLSRESSSPELGPQPIAGPNSNPFVHCPGCAHYNRGA